MKYSEKTINFLSSSTRYTDVTADFSMINGSSGALKGGKLSVKAGSRTVASNFTNELHTIHKASELLKVNNSAIKTNNNL